MGEKGCSCKCSHAELGWNVMLDGIVGWSENTVKTTENAAHDPRIVISYFFIPLCEFPRSPSQILPVSVEYTVHGSVGDDVESSTIRKIEQRQP